MLTSVLAVLLLGYLALATIALFMADRLIFLPPSSSYAPGELPIVPIAGVDGGLIATLHLPNDSATFTLLFSHGNAEDLGHIAWLLARLRDEVGVAVLAYDYRGYGLSTGGPPSAAGASRDLEAVYEYATGELGLSPDRLIVHGRSVGTGPGLELASHRPVGALVVESGFVSAFRVVTRVPLLPFDRFPNLRHIREVSVPVLVIHGERDDVIPFSHGERLFAAAPGPKWHFWVAGAGHNDLLHVAGDEYWRVLRDFVRTLEARRDGEPRVNLERP